MFSEPLKKIIDRSDGAVHVGEDFRLPLFVADDPAIRLDPRGGVHETEAAGDHHKLYDPPRGRQIGHVSSVPAMDTSGDRSAQWTQTNASRRPDRNNSLITFVVRTLYNKPTRHQTGALECLLHGG